VFCTTGVYIHILWRLVLLASTCTCCTCGYGNLVSTPYINVYVSRNKLVLSYLLSRLLSQWWPRSGCTLCTVHCTSVHSHMSVVTSAGCSLFCPWTWYFVPFRSVHLNSYNFLSASRLDFPLKSTNFCFSLLKVSCSYHSTPFLNKFIFVLVPVLDPGPYIRPSAHFCIRFLF
jgi:hypothetical protein